MPVIASKFILSFSLVRTISRWDTIQIGTVTDQYTEHFELSNKRITDSFKDLYLNDAEKLDLGTVSFETLFAVLPFMTQSEVILNKETLIVIQEAKEKIVQVRNDIMPIRHKHDMAYIRRILEWMEAWINYSINFKFVLTLKIKVDLTTLQIE